MLQSYNGKMTESTSSSDISGIRRLKVILSRHDLLPTDDDDHDGSRPPRPDDDKATRLWSSLMSDEEWKSLFPLKAQDLSLASDTIASWVLRLFNNENNNKDDNNGGTSTKANPNDGSVSPVTADIIAQEFLQEYKKGWWNLKDDHISAPAKAPTETVDSRKRQRQQQKEGDEDAASEKTTTNHRGKSRRRQDSDDKRRPDFTSLLNQEAQLANSIHYSRVAWTPAEDAIILEGVSSACSFSEIAKRLSANHHDHHRHRSPASVSHRWANYLNPILDHSPFTPTDDWRLIEATQRFGRFEEISRIVFQGRRSQVALKHRWSTPFFQQLLHRSHQVGAIKAFDELLRGGQQQHQVPHPFVPFYQAPPAGYHYHAAPHHRGGVVQPASSSRQRPAGNSSQTATVAQGVSNPPRESTTKAHGSAKNGKKSGASVRPSTQPTAASTGSKKNGTHASTSDPKASSSKESGKQKKSPEGTTTAQNLAKDSSSTAPKEDAILTAAVVNSSSSDTTSAWGDIATQLKNHRPMPTVVSRRWTNYSNPKRDH